MADLAKLDVLIDMCLQREYLAPEFDARCSNAVGVLRAARHLMAFARWSRMPILTCIDTHRPHDIGDNFVTGAGEGDATERMLGFTQMPNMTIVESDNSLGMALDVLERFQQAVFTKVHKDPFTNPKLERLLTEMPSRRFVVFGVPLESSVRLLILGLLMRGRRVALVEDACGYWSEAEAAMVLRQLGVKGCELLTADCYVRDSVSQLSSRRMRRRGRNVA